MLLRLFFGCTLQALGFSCGSRLNPYGHCRDGFKPQVACVVKAAFMVETNGIELLTQASNFLKYKASVQYR
jgi:hypothetical protein